MAELLVVAGDRPVPDSGGRWYKGMVVEIRENGSPYGRKEGLPRFVVIKIPSLPISLFEALMDEDLEDEKLKTRRKAAVKPEIVDDAMLLGGVVTIPDNKAGRFLADSVVATIRREP